MVNSAYFTRLVVITGIFVLLLPLSSIQHFIWVILQLFAQYSRLLRSAGDKLSSLFLVRHAPSPPYKLHTDNLLLPLSWCLLADFCNHTWIPECGFDELVDKRRLFIDECDMFEYNCDNEMDFEMVNYTECFTTGPCPTAPPCPSHPTCPDHRYHRMGDHYMYPEPRRQGRRMLELGHTLPSNMLKGKRRYTPETKKKRRDRHQATKTTTPRGRSNRRPRTSPMTRHHLNTEMPTATETIILKREIINKYGKKLVKVVKGKFAGKGKPLKIIEELERDNDKDSDFLE